MVVQTALNDLLALEYDIDVDASPLVEISYLHSDSEDYTLVGLANLSGQLGMAYHKPLPIFDIPIKLRTDKPVSRIRYKNPGIQQN